MKSYIYRNEINPRTLHNKLIREKEVFYDTEEAINSPDIVHLLMTELFGLDRRAEEYMFMIALNSKSHPLGFFEVSHGTCNTTVVSPREIFVRGMLAGAVSVIICHNHPSKNPTPSMEDISVTKRIKEAGELVGITLTDHVIIGGKTYCSLKEKGII